jgi:nitrite reductase/ring-hydroxylating ferredoxin subunit
VNPRLSSRLRNLPRRSLFRAVFWLCVAPLAAAFGILVDRHERTSRHPRRVELPNDLGEGITFVDEVIVSRRGGATLVFAARCTHLGCRITGSSEGLLVCPCHGSKFRADGSVASGPAARPLERLRLETDEQTGGPIVHVV